MLNVSTKAKNQKLQKVSGTKQYLGLFILAALYFVGNYGFTFNFKELISSVKMSDFILFGFVFIGFVLTVITSILKFSYRAIKKLICAKIALLGSYTIDSSLVSLKFKDMMQRKQLSRNQILEFLNQLNKLLPVSQQKYYSKYNFENECHEIYTKLKNKKLKNIDNVKLLKLLEQFQKEKQLEDTVRRPHPTTQVVKLYKS